MDRNTKTIVVIGLIAIVAALSIGYATLSQTIQINSSAKINAGTWNVNTTLTSSSTPCTYNGTAISGITPTISGTGTITITIPQVSLSLPGDTVVCTVPIKNNGTINAELNYLNVTAPTISNNSYSSLFTASVAYDGVTYTGNNPSLGLALNTNATKNVVITYTFSAAATTVPSSAVTLTGLQVALNYQQA